ncbi:MAG: lipopolysaccharide modification acyltransferase [Phycisphaerales bacterium]|nr:lipopolysaccharide modification acyltransferase [Phycisphaerales bacterium]MDB5354849.1 lipopolysaccharide modification acyltransferase [Phycisphaerales bacterium]
MPGPHATPLLALGATLWHRVGWVGVDLFFVLSGFLVAGLLFAEYRERGAVNVRRFLVRRGLKIYPPFYLMLAVTVAASLALGEPIPVKALLGEVFFLQSYLPRLWVSTWSLAVEEHFYILLAAIVAGLIAFVRVRPLRIVPAIFLIVAPLALAARIFASYGRPFSDNAQLYPTHLRIDSLLFGVLLAYLHHFHADPLAAAVRKYRTLLLIAAAALIAPALKLDVSSTFMHTIGLTFLSLGFGMLLLVAVHSKSAGDSKTVAAFGKMGAYSYSIYLWHLPFSDYMLRTLSLLPGGPVSSITTVAIYVAGSIATGIIMAKLVELPVLRLRDRLFPSHAAAGVSWHGSTSSPRIERPRASIIA